METKTREYVVYDFSNALNKNKVFFKKNHIKFLLKKCEIIFRAHCGHDFLIENCHYYFFGIFFSDFLSSLTWRLEKEKGWDEKLGNCWKDGEGFENDEKGWSAMNINQIKKTSKSH